MSDAVSQLQLFAATKRCPRCTEVLPLDQFPGWYPGRQGQFGYCSACRRAYMRHYYRRPRTEAQQRRIAYRSAARWIYSRVVPPMSRDVIGLYRRAVAADPCAYCGEMPKPCKWTGRPDGTIDHIVPKSGSGELNWSNETASCWSCNRYKTNKPLLAFLLEIADHKPVF